MKTPSSPTEAFEALLEGRLYWERTGSLVSPGACQVINLLYSWTSFRIKEPPRVVYVNVYRGYLAGYYHGITTASMDVDQDRLTILRITIDGEDVTVDQVDEQGEVIGMDIDAAVADVYAKRPRKSGTATIKWNNEDEQGEVVK